VCGVVPLASDYQTRPCMWLTGADAVACPSPSLSSINTSQVGQCSQSWCVGGGHGDWWRGWQVLHT
jgi:hypothetical protein